MEDKDDTGQLSIYRAARTIKRRDNSLYNALRSIYDDSVFVGEIFQLWPDLPLLANLRCGLWYSRSFHATCYFKSTDGHNNNWSFNTSRLNLHVAQLAGTLCFCSVFGFWMCLGFDLVSNWVRGRTERRVFYCGCNSEREAVSGQHVEDDSDLDLRFESLDSKP